MNDDTNSKELDENIEVFTRFCQVIFGAEAFSIRCVAERKDLKGKIEALGVKGKGLSIRKFGSDTAKEIQILGAQKANQMGFAVFYLPQEYQAKQSEESYAFITYFRAFVVDLDGAPLEPVLSFSIKPTLIVETSAGKYQCIWRLREKVMCVAVAGTACNGHGMGRTVEEYNLLLSNLASLLDGDQSTCKATQCFRAPGFLHQKAEPFLSRIIGELGERCSWEELAAAVAVRGSAGLGRDSAGKIDLHKLARGEVKVPKGLRHETLLAYQVKLLHEGKSEDDVLEECVRVAIESFEEGAEFLAGGRRASEIRKTIDDAKGYVEKAKADELAILGSVTAKAAAQVSGFKYDYNAGPLSVNRFSHSAIAERVLQRFSDDLARIDKRVYCFNGMSKTWAVQSAELFAETKGRVFACIRDTVNEKEFIKTCCMDSKGKYSAKFRHSAEVELYRSNNVNAMCKSVLNHMAIKRYSYGDFDADADVMYLENGVFNLRTKEIREARSTDKLLCRSKVRWEAEATCPGWLEFLSEVFAENEEPTEMITFLQELFAYSLSGNIGEQKVFCYQGDGANGKSKTLDALKAISGDYHTIVEPDELVQKSGSFRQKTFERTGAKVEGRRVVIIDDFEVDSAWNESFVKVLTGPEIRARAEYEHSRVSPNRSKFHIGLNRAPKPEAENLGILRRLCFIPFRRTFEPSSVKSRQIDEMIIREARGIFRWAIGGYERVVSDGIKYPAETLAALETYRHENFKIESIIEELFDRPKQESDGEWLTLAELVSKVHDEVHDGTVGVPYISSDALGIALKRSNFMHFKKYNSKCMNTVSHFFVKVRETRKKNHALDELL